MIFLVAKNEPTMFIMLTEADVQSMREGRTQFVDQRMTKGNKFNKVILSVHPTHEDIAKIIHQAGHTIPQLTPPEPAPNQSVCIGCKGLIDTHTLFEGKCIVCWATEAKLKPC